MADVTPSSDPPLGQALGQAVELGESPNRRAWLRFRDNRPAMGASVFLIALVLLAVCWPWVSDLGNQHSDAQFAELAVEGGDALRGRERELEGERVLAARALDGRETGRGKFGKVLQKSCI